MPTLVFPVPSRAGTYVGTYADGERIRVKLQCVANCDEVECSHGCDDSDPCTGDECIRGEGCRHTPLDGTECTADLCTMPGHCVSGTCEPGAPIDCDDQDQCSTDLCVPAWGCVYPDDNHIIDNSDPTDCVAVACFGDRVIEDLPVDSEIPPQDSPTDCLIQVCMDGEVVDADDFSEPGCE